jgi:hypothetical protein
MIAVYLSISVYLAWFMSKWVELGSYWDAVWSNWWTHMALFFVIVPLGAIGLMLDVKAIEAKEKPNA